MRRKTAPKVRDGRVQRKNRHTPTRAHGDLLPLPAINRLPAGRGYRHVVEPEDVERFVRLLSDWDELSRGIRAIVLASGDDDLQGWYGWDNVIAVCAWPRELVDVWDREFQIAHAPVTDRLGVTTEPDEDGVLLGFDEASARGFQLMHVFLHELGHHHDRMSTKNQRWCARGERYAEDYAIRRAEVLWPAYFREFGG